MKTKDILFPIFILIGLTFGQTTNPTTNQFGPETPQTRPPAKPKESQITDPILNKIRVGDFIEKKELEQDEQVFYNLTIGTELYPDEDLIIKVIPLDYSSDPDVYISKTELYPNSSLTSEWQCQSYGKDTCTLNHQNLTRNTSYFVGIICDSLTPCTFQVRVLLTSEFVLEDGVEFQTELFTEDARVFKFVIPPQLQDEDNASVLIKASAYRGTVHDFNLAVVGSDKEGESQEDIKGVPAWKKGQVIRINKDNYKGWCKGCEIKILLDVNDSGYYHIMAQTTDSQPILINYQQVDDLVSFNSTQCYRYFVFSPDTDVQLQLTTYSGKVTLYANPDSIPANEDDFRIRTDSNETTDLYLDMRPWVRQHIARQVTGLYFICVKGEYMSTYTLRIKEFMQNMSEPIHIEDGYAEYFYQRGEGMQLFTYTVPPIPEDYPDEDFKLDFSLTIKRGNAELILAATMCDKNTTEECIQGLSTELILQKGQTKFQKGVQTTSGSIRLVIDHDEELCKKELQGKPCVYIIAVIKQQASEHERGVRYKLVATHMQNNHQLLQEGTPHIDSVDMKRFKYFKFTLLEDSSNINNVTIEVSPLHGDCDIFVTQGDNPVTMFPDKDKFDKKSQRIGALVDHVKFQAEQNVETSNTSTAGVITNQTIKALNGTYYIGVYGYSYATFHLMVTVNRKQKTLLDRVNTAFTTLFEGFPLTKRLHNEFDFFLGHFQVEIPEKEDHQIIIDLQNSEAKTKAYLSYNSIPSLLQYDLKLDGEGSIRLNSSNETGLYHRTGQYCILVVPNFGFFDLFLDNYYTFSLQWRTEDTIPHLNSQQMQTVITKPQGYSYLRHYVQDTQEDIRISLLSKTGHQDVYVVLGNSKGKPSNATYDFTTKYMRGGNYINGKALLMPIALLQNTNEACKDLGYAEEEACLLNIAIYCQDNNDCESQIELDYESRAPKRIYSGQTKHSIMYPDSKHFYFMSVSEDNLSDIFAVMSPLTGDADLYVNIQLLSKSEAANSHSYVTNWTLPSEVNNTYESRTKLNTEMIRIPKDELTKHCGFQKDKKQPDDIECLIIFGIIPYIEVKSTNTTSQADEEIVYNFVVYKNFMQLQAFTPTYGFVKEGDFAYFLYKETCNSCHLIISLSSHSNGSPDIFINKGLRLPSQNEYDLKRSTLHSEVIDINILDTPFLRTVNDVQPSMADYYVIGVYAQKNTTFQINAGSSVDKVTSISEGISLSNGQMPFGMNYFQYYHFSKMTDVQISLSVSSGNVDVYVTTYDNKVDNFVTKLPQRKDDAIWLVEGLSSMNQGQDDKSVLILQNDKYYCLDCYYIIGVVTHEQESIYRITVKSLEAERSSSSQLLRLGQTKVVKLQNSTSVQRFQFMLDSKDPATIIPTVISGRVKILVSFQELPDSFAAEEGSNPIQIIGNRIQTEQNYYVFVQSMTDSAEVAVTVQQKHTIVTLNDGIPQMINYENSNDISKYLLYNLPSGSSTTVFYIRSKTAGFFPKLYLTQQTQDQLANMTFPPDELIKYEIYQDWDRDLYAMKASITFKDLPEKSFLAMNLMYNKPKQEEDDPTLPPSPHQVEEESKQAAQAMITVSHTKISKLASGEDYYGTLSEGFYSFQLFKIVNPSKKVTKVSFAQCIGNTRISIVKDANRLADSIRMNMNEENGLKVALINDIPQESYILVESFSVDPKALHEFFVRVDFYDSDDDHLVQQSLYIPSNGGRIDYEYVREHKMNVKLKWSPVYQMNSYTGEYDKMTSGVRYKLVFSTNPDVVMDSVCAIKHSLNKVQTLYEDENSDFEYVTKLPHDEEIQFNVFAVIDSQQTAVPYRPVSMKVPKRVSTGGRMFVSILVGIIVIFAIIAYYFFIKGRKLQQRLKAEIRELRTGGTQSYRRVHDERSSTLSFS